MSRQTEATAALAINSVLKVESGRVRLFSANKVAPERKVVKNNLQRRRETVVLQGLKRQYTCKCSGMKDAIKTAHHGAAERDSCLQETNPHNVRRRPVQICRRF